jgi:D-alanine-D-alanine ligase-like ATP-grasp enzyme
VKVAILANLEAGRRDADVVVGQVERALAARGDKVSTIATYDDVEHVLGELRAAKPDLVFNLFESFGDEVIGGQMGVTGLLDLLQLPYTGVGPGEMYLQEDKA